MRCSTSSLYNELKIKLHFQYSKVAFSDVSQNCEKRLLDLCLSVGQTVGMKQIDYRRMDFLELLSKDL